MFVGRKKELELLNHLYKRNRFEFITVTGRKHIGKTRLLAEFFKEKQGIYFNAVEGKEKLNLEILSREIFEFKNKHLTSSVFNSFLEALTYIFELSLDEHFVFIIDEYPYLVNAFPAISSILQMLIDKYQDRSKLMLILSGSSISFMENEVIAYKAPLYGRKTAQLKIEPLNFKDSLTYFDTNNEEKVAYYGIYGGTPYYLNQINPTKTLEDNLTSTFLTTSSFLYEEPNNLLKQEVFELSSYFSVLTAIAEGATKLSEIATKAGISTSTAAKIVNNLIELDLIKKEYPFNEKRSKRSLYRLKDNAFKFWFKFIPNNLSLINRDLSEIALKNIEPHLSEYLGFVFEEIAQEYLWELLKADKSPVEFSSLGRWWGTDHKIKSQIEIDIMGNNGSNVGLFCECKWTNEKVGSKILKDLIKKSQNFTYLNNFYFLFSKNGFTDHLISLAKEIPNIYLISLDDMIDFLEKTR